MLKVHFPFISVQINTGRTATARRKFPTDKLRTNKLGIVRSCVFLYVTAIIKKFPSAANTRITNANPTSRITCSDDLFSSFWKVLADLTTAFSVKFMSSDHISLSHQKYWLILSKVIISMIFDFPIKILWYYTRACSWANLLSFTAVTKTLSPSRENTHCEVDKQVRFHKYSNSLMKNKVGFQNTVLFLFEQSQQVKVGFYNPHFLS